ncbi:preprotein translocase subunit YajC [Deferrisoma camini]|uniref:preprotein translocase subunit YajC n=1 Tax=Deferrisoma camini TaxID=1035120 RepID=UPI00046C95F1|nr:preprotein translocase subunit YajC [Deferrisoma camini]
MDFLFPATAFAMGAQGGAGSGAQGNPIVSLLPLILMFVIFYVLLIRPQQKRQKEHKAMLEALQRGDEVVTSGGIHARVTGVTDETVTLEIAPNVKIKVSKPAIATVKKRGG